MGIFSLSRNEPLTPTVGHVRSYFRPAFLDRLIAKPSASEAARTLSQARIAKERAMIRAKCDEMAESMGLPAIRWPS